MSRLLSGFIAAHATLSSGDVDLCLIPEAPIELKGENSCLEHLARTVAARGHAVVVVSEGAGVRIQRLVCSCCAVTLSTSMIDVTRHMFTVALLYSLSKGKPLANVGALCLLNVRASTQSVAPPGGAARRCGAARPGGSGRRRPRLPAADRGVHEGSDQEASLGQAGRGKPQVSGHATPPLEGSLSPQLSCLLPELHAECWTCAFVCSCLNP